MTFHSYGQFLSTCNVTPQNTCLHIGINRHLSNQKVHIFPNDGKHKYALRGYK